MAHITDPVISRSGRIYSLAGVKRLLGEVTKRGCYVGNTKTQKRKTRSYGKI